MKPYIANPSFTCFISSDIDDRGKLWTSRKGFSRTSVHRWNAATYYQEQHVGGTVFVFVRTGSVRILLRHHDSEWMKVSNRHFSLKKGMWGSFPEGIYDIIPSKNADILAIQNPKYYGGLTFGGFVGTQGRLRYIDGCTDDLLIPPTLKGNPCLNALYFPAGVNQTQHTHPSFRVGMVVRGEGECVTPYGTFPLTPGMIFIIHAGTKGPEGLHSFRTEKGMVVVAYHPDSDYGPEHENHPMINRTIVKGVPASKIKKIHTRK
jgi:hypothetical protein